MKINIFIVSIIMLGVSILGYFRWIEEAKDTVFECRAKLYNESPANLCQGKADYDLFISMHDNGSGFIMLLGTFTCPNQHPKLIDTVVDFSYKKEGSYYSINFGKRPTELSRLIKEFKYDSVKIKIKEMDTSESLVYLPFQSPFFCRRD